jgi:hypothetical protein
MLHMTSPPIAPARRLVLVPATPRTGRSDATVRRFRLARVRLEDRDVPRARKN